MRSRFTAAICLTLFASIAAADDKQVETAVEKAVKYLLKQQGPAGDWGGPDRIGEQPAVTSLCALAFLASGHKPGKGTEGAAIEKAALSVLKAQQEDGLIAFDGNRMPMYGHGISVLMLAETWIKADPKLREKIQPALKKGVELIVKSQVKEGEHKGGWRYRPTQLDGDMSVTGWQIFALCACQKAGFDVPAATLSQATGFVKKCESKGGGFFYYPTLQEPTPSCTAAGIWALLLLESREENSRTMAAKAADDLNKRWDSFFKPAKMYYFDSAGKAAGAMVRLGDKRWEQFKPKLYEPLLSKQKENGAWFGDGADGKSIGPHYCTAMAILALTAEQQHLSIHKRDLEEPKKKEK